jgi:hypothetical protein
MFGKQIQQGGFSAPVGTDNATEHTRPEGQGDVVNDFFFRIRETHTG